MIIITEGTKTNIWHDLIMLHQGAVFILTYHAEMFRFATLDSVWVVATVVNSLLKVCCLNQQFT